jgi:uncharacterized protein (DUF58 family)
VSSERELTLTGALLCATAALLGVPALYVPGLAALLAAALAPAWVILSARGTEVDLACTSLTAQEGDRVQVRVTARRGAVPFPAGTLAPWPGAEELGLPVGRRSIEVGAQVLLARRGRHHVGPARVRISDPFGLCARERQSGSAELLVLPRVDRLDAAALAFLDGAGRSSPEAPQALDALRAHRPGSPASRIHWPTVARSGVLMEHAMKPEDDARVLVELDASFPASEEALDRVVRAAASLCVHLARRGGCLVALPDDPRPALLGSDLVGWPALHARLALIAPGTSTRRARIPRRGLSVILLTASAESERSPTGPHLRVGPHPLAGPATLFRLAGCSAQYLEGHRQTRAA